MDDYEFLFYLIRGLLIALIGGCFAWALIATASRKRKERQRQEHLQRLKEEADAWIKRMNGQSLSPIENPSVKLKAGEAVFLSWRGALYETRAVRHYVSSGMSARVARGLYVNGRRGTSTSVETWTYLSGGDFIVTNKRILFSGDPASRVVELHNLVSATLEDPETLLVNSSSRQKTMRFVLPNEKIAQVIIDSVSNSNQ